MFLFLKNYSHLALLLQQPPTSSFDCFIKTVCVLVIPSSIRKRSCLFFVSDEHIKVLFTQLRILSFFCSFVSIVRTEWVKTEEPWGEFWEIFEPMFWRWKKDDDETGLDSVSREKAASAATQKLKLCPNYSRVAASPSASISASAWIVPSRKCLYKDEWGQVMQ